MSRYSKEDIAVVILNWNGKELLETFLPSVIKHSETAKIYVIDNASEDESVKILKEKFPSVALIELKKNLGYAGGYNSGLKSITESIVCCLNSDVEVSSNWLTPILEVFNSDENVAIVQPKILDYKKKGYFEYAGAAGGFIDKYGYPYCRGRVFDAIEKDEGQYNDVKEVFWASGACFFVLKDRFEDLGGFDSYFFAHMEEIDLCWRAFNNGYKVIYQGKSHVYHVGGSTLKNSSPQKTFLNFRNSLFTLIKNSPAPFLLIMSRLVLDGIAGIRFLVKLQFQHFLAIIHAHLSFYSKLLIMLKKRKTHSEKRLDYYESKSIVWKYFIKKETKF